MRAAVDCGADAVYFGLSDFSARARATNFSPEALPEVMAALHERGVLGFVTFNTLVFDEELEVAAQRIRTMSDAGVDAVIVQDLGVARLIRQIAPDLPVHGSTQMTITSGEGASFVAGLGVERVVLARELSLSEIAAVGRSTDLEIEVFVHGALCVSYSGQCFSSEAWGGRSANRGQCAQACRLPYDLVVDGKVAPTGGAAYLLSPQDLMGIDQVPALIEAGVSCFKIEGRLKGAEYVAQTTTSYRRAIDEAWAGRRHRLGDAERAALETVYSRGLTPGFLEGSQHQRLVRGFYPDHRGPCVGTVLESTDRTLLAELTAPIQSGDGLVFETPAKAEDLGAQVVRIERVGGHHRLLLGKGFSGGRLRGGEKIWRNRSPEIERSIRRSSGADAHRVTISASVSGATGEALVLQLTDSAGRVGTASSAAPLEPARNRGLDTNSLKTRFGRMGESAFALGDLQSDLVGDLFLPASELNAVRRRAVEALRSVRRAPPSRRLGEATPVKKPGPQALLEPSLSVLCRSLEQVIAATKIEGVTEIAVDFLEVKGLGEGIAAVRDAGITAVAVPPRILKPDEERLRAFLLKLGADAILVRSLGLLHSLGSLPASGRPRLFGDFSLGATNVRTAELLLESGLERLAPSHDLNADQLCALGDSGLGPQLELILHHHLPIFHTEHCVFARFLSSGNNRSDCGHPCEDHEVHLQGRDGARHLVRADVGCRNTVFNAQAQSGLRRYRSFFGAGYRRFRVELADHTGCEVGPLVSRVTDVLRGDRSGRDVYWWLRDETRYSATIGSLRVIDEHTDLKRPGGGSA